MPIVEVNNLTLLIFVLSLHFKVTSSDTKRTPSELRVQLGVISPEQL
jgi:hypothetical protein